MRLYAISGSVILLGFVLLAAVQSPHDSTSSIETPPEGASSADQTTADYAQIRALTYNIFMRPAPVSWGDKIDCRARGIAAQLNNEARARDVVVLTESFAPKAVQLLAGSTHHRYPHQVLSQPEARGLSVNGGVSILSPHPIEAWSATAFEKCHGKLNDCLATKGFVWARLRITEELKINVLATHLNSGGSRRARATRRGQLAQIRAFLDTQPSIAKWPTLLMGDLNINGLRWAARSPKNARLTEYGEMMDLLGNTCAACDDAGCSRYCTALPVDTFRATQKPWAYTEAQTRTANTYNCRHEMMAPCQSPNRPEQWKERLRIDYILHFGPPKNASQIEARTLSSNTLSLADNTCDTSYLSDHKALESTLEIGRLPLVKAQLDPHDSDAVLPAYPARENDLN